jgi:hypothetical protein
MDRDEALKLLRGGREGVAEWNLKKNVYHCFSCDAGGNILDFVSTMEDVAIRPAALLLVDWFNLQRTAVTKRPSKKSLAPAGGKRGGRSLRDRNPTLRSGGIV